MKRFLRKLTVALAVICATATVVAQPLQPVPTDPDVRIGHLDNGLTYYIRHNALPARQADFYIAQKVGSILEEDHQRGLAHFLEHMCFNGTEHFPGNSLRTYLESIGVKFGANLNAYTSVDETVYNISNVPVLRDGIIDSCLLILHDWADALTLDPKEIDKERGVIHEEWRTSMGAMMRMYEKVFPVLFKDSKYAYRLPIGTMEVVDHFPYQALRDYYEKWYRPDLQGIIVVGDIDPDSIERKIKEVFGPIRMPEPAAPRTYFPVPDNKEPLIAITSDKEQQVMQLLLMHKHDAYPAEGKKNVGYLAYQFMTSLVELMLNTRLDELTQRADPPFIGAGVGEGDFILSKTKAAFIGYAACREDGFGTAFSALYREVLRARQYGFTSSEYERAKADYLRSIETAYNERNTMKNSHYVSQCVSHFIDGEPLPSIEQEFGIVNQIVPAIPLEQVNAFFRQLIGDENMAVAILCPEKEGLVLPTEADVTRLIAQVKSEPLEAYVDQVSDEPLLQELPQGGKTVKTEAGVFGSTVLTLSNGVRVIVKPTDFKADEIRMNAFSNGGTSVFSETEALQYKELNAIIGLGGLGNFNAIDLQKVLSGKIASATASVRQLTEAVNGSCSPKDLETMLQLTYLSFTAPRRDDEAFASYRTRLKAQLENMEANPDVAFSDSISRALYGDNPRTVRMKAADVDRLDYGRILQLYQDRFADASDFTFVLVGNMDLATAGPLLEQYLGALPSTGRKETFADVLPLRKGTYSNVFQKQLETAKASELLLKWADTDYTLRNHLLTSMMTQLLDMEYTETVREEAGGTYGVRVHGELNKYPTSQAMLQIYFDTDPKRRTEMVKLIDEGIRQLAADGPKAENLQKVKEYLLKKYQQDQKENSYWMGQLYHFYWTGVDGVTDYVQTVNAISAQDLREFARTFFGHQNSIEVSMTSN